jgi:hypothetical protein
VLRIEIQSDHSTDVGVMDAHCFREKKKRAGRVEKNRSDHFNANVQRTTWLRNLRAESASTLVSGAGQHATIFCLAKSLNMRCMIACD